MLIPCLGCDQMVRIVADILLKTFQAIILVSTIYQLKRKSGSNVPWLQVS